MKDSDVIPLLSENVYDNKKSRNLNDILLCIGLNKKIIYVYIAINMGILVDGMEMTLMSLFLIPIQKYFKISNFILQIISSVFFIGVAIGSYLSGYLLKFSSRKNILNFSYILMFIFHVFLSLFTMHYFFFLINRILIGICLGIIVPISLNIIKEFLAEENQSFYLTAVWASFGIGQALNPIVMYIGMKHFEKKNLNITLFSLSVFILITIILNSNLIIETPYELINNKKYDDCYNLLNSMLLENNKKLLTEDEKENLCNKNKREIDNKANYSISILFNKNLRKLTLISICILTIVSFLLYGVLLISTLTMKTFNIAKSNKTKPKKILIDQIYTAFSTVLANILAAVLCEISFIGKKNSIYLGFSISTISCILIIFFGKYYYRILFSLYLSFMLISFNVFLTYIIEIFPTHFHHLSSGFLFSCLRIAGFLSQYVYLFLNDIYFLLPYLFSAIISSIAIYLTYILPNKIINFEDNGKMKSINYDNKLINI